MTNLNKNIEELKKLQQQVFNDYTQKKSELEKLKQEVEKKERGLPDVKRKKDQITVSLNSLDSKVKQLRNDLQQAESAKEEEKRLFEEYKNEEIKLNAELKEKSAKYSTLKTEVDGLRLRMQDLLRQIEQLNKQANVKI